MHVSLSSSALVPLSSLSHHKWWVRVIFPLIDAVQDVVATLEWAWKICLKFLLYILYKCRITWPFDWLGWQDVQYITKEIKIPRLAVQAIRNVQIMRMSMVYMYMYYYVHVAQGIYMKYNQQMYSHRYLAWNSGGSMICDRRGQVYENFATMPPNSWPHPLNCHSTLVNTR